MKIKRSQKSLKGNQDNGKENLRLSERNCSFKYRYRVDLSFFMRFTINVLRFLNSVNYWLVWAVCNSKGENCVCVKVAKIQFEKAVKRPS